MDLYCGFKKKSGMEKNLETSLHNAYQIKKKRSSKEREHKRE
jgi:hypothetical protein